MDRIDRAILRTLQQRGRIANVDLAELVGLSPSACLRRVRELEEQDLITGYHAALNNAALGFPVQVIVQIALNSQSAESLATFEAAVDSIPNVIVCYLMTGVHDYLLRVAARSVSDFERIHKEYLSALPHVARMESSIALREVVNRPLAADVT